MKKATAKTIRSVLSDDRISRKGLKHLLCLSACSVVLLCGTAIAEEGRPSPPNRVDKQKMLLLEYAKRRQVDVYGKVIDQWMNGVPDADVCISGHTADWMLGKRDKPYEVRAKTDKDGLFHAVLKYPNRAYPSASKDGYELLGRYYTDLVQHRTTPENPVVLQMRKKGEAVFLIRKSISPLQNYLLLADGTNRMTKALDMLMSLTDAKSPPVEYADIIGDGAYDASEKVWTLTLSVTNGMDGMVLSDRLLHEAPADGYRKQCVIRVMNQSLQTKYVYLRSRQPAVYSRIELNYNLCYDPGKPDYLRVYYNFWLNPYGERSFEYDERVEAGFNVRQTLAKEARTAIRSGKYPPKPTDVERLVREANEWFKRDNEEKKRRNKEWQEEQKRLRESKDK